MNIKNNKKSQISKEKIQKTLYKLLKTTPFNEITITYLCKESKINRTTFYAHYDHIEDVVLNICEEHIIKMYSIFLNTNISYKERVKQSLYLIKDNLEFYSYVFTNVHNLELKVIELIEYSCFNKAPLQVYEKAKLSLAFIISGFIGIGKTYFYDLKANKTKKLSLNDFSELITNVINKDNPYFVIE